MMSYPQDPLKHRIIIAASFTEEDYYNFLKSFDFKSMDKGGCLEFKEHLQATAKEVSNIEVKYEAIHKIHKIKIKLPFYKEILKRNKTFEIRKNDRNYQVGDIVCLRPVDQKEDFIYALEPIKKVITYITDYGMKEGYITFGIADIEKD